MRGANAGAGGGALFYRRHSQGAGKGKAGPGIAFEHEVQGGEAGMLRRCFGAFTQGTAAGLAVRHDHGIRYMSDAFQREARFLCIGSTPAFVRAPKGNGCAERFIRVPEENLLWLRAFDTVEESHCALTEFRKTHSAARLIERHGLRPPGAVRQDQNSTVALAA